MAAAPVDADKMASGVRRGASGCRCVGQRRAAPPSGGGSVAGLRGENQDLIVETVRYVATAEKRTGLFGDDGRDRSPVMPNDESDVGRQRLAEAGFRSRIDLNAKLLKRDVAKSLDAPRDPAARERNIEVGVAVRVGDETAGVERLTDAGEQVAYAARRLSASVRPVEDEPPGRIGAVALQVGENCLETRLGRARGGACRLIGRVR